MRRLGHDIAAIHHFRDTNAEISLSPRAVISALKRPDIRWRAHSLTRIIGMPESHGILSDNSGAATIELALVLALLVIAIMGTAASFGDGVTSSFDRTAQQVAGANG